MQPVEHLPIAASDEIELIEIGGRAARQQRQIKRKCLPRMRERERSAAPAKTVMLVGPLAVSSLSPDAASGEKPSQIRTAAVTATGVPKPEAPSKKAPNAKAISSTCKRRSGVTPPIACCKVPKAPVVTVSRYMKMTLSTIQPIGKKPMTGCSTTERSLPRAAGLKISPKGAAIMNANLYTASVPEPTFADLEIELGRGQHHDLSLVRTRASESNEWHRHRFGIGRARHQTSNSALWQPGRCWRRTFPQRIARIGNTRHSWAVLLTISRRN